MFIAHKSRSGWVKQFVKVTKKADLLILEKHLGISTLVFIFTISNFPV
jgi:hypothetical protein